MDRIGRIGGAALPTASAAAVAITQSARPNHATSLGRTWLRRWRGLLAHQVLVDLISTRAAPCLAGPAMNEYRQHVHRLTLLPASAATRPTRWRFPAALPPLSSRQRRTSATDKTATLTVLAMRGCGCGHRMIISPSVAHRLECKDAPPVVLHADNRPRPGFRLLHERAGECANRGVWQPSRGPISEFADRVVVVNQHF